MAGKLHIVLPPLKARRSSSMSGHQIGKIRKLNRPLSAIRIEMKDQKFKNFNESLIKSLNKRLKKKDKSMIVKTSIGT